KLILELGQASGGQGADVGTTGVDEADDDDPALDQVIVKADGLSVLCLHLKIRNVTLAPRAALGFTEVRHCDSRGGSQYHRCRPVPSHVRLRIASLTARDRASRPKVSFSSWRE